MIVQFLLNPHRSFTSAVWCNIKQCMHFVLFVCLFVLAQSSRSSRPQRNFIEKCSDSSPLPLRLWIGEMKHAFQVSRRNCGAIFLRPILKMTAAQPRATVGLFVFPPVKNTSTYETEIDVIDIAKRMSCLAIASTIPYAHDSP